MKCQLRKGGNFCKVIKVRCTTKDEICFAEKKREKVRDRVKECEKKTQEVLGR